ncbi:Metallo-dependent hydrolase [Fragilariopsis cylindrus CCMP1102]|uniref:Metallo-dependent hydrolase n=1 Tax=Fragilariopsis cylindrus CCMP1102 TaxID=635003 RepID=A0A1E7EX74_9STRA|nr:Metallo-dependent hydrolase [Fragilariopsis cylindrus CCMP1102]|eukprot:OEU10561.1 Metallo-dependent hydrolase [Fragilariopsis cylindrus CCMP1102]
MAPGIIDVDCNLLHGDLYTLQKASTTTTTDTDNAWNILHEDAIKDANIVAILSPSSTILESEKSLELLKSDPPPPILIKTTVGVHPYHEQKKRMKNIIMMDREEEEQNTNTNRFCAAVGECGLDASEGFPSLEHQVPWFQMQIEIASELEMPLFVHERLAFDKTLELLEKAAPKIPIIIHCFTGTKEECIEYIKRGYFISISGYILKESNDNCAEVISCLEEGVIPPSKLMIETDAPYMGFSGCRQLYLDHNQEYVSSLNSKKRKRLQQSIYPNVPSSLPMVLSKVTECLQKHDSTLTREKIAEMTTANARTFFGL